MRVCAHTCRQLHHGRTPTRSVRLGGVGGYCHVRPVQADGIKQKLRRQVPGQPAEEGQLDEACEGAG